MMIWDNPKLLFGGSHIRQSESGYKDIDEGMLKFIIKQALYFGVINVVSSDHWGYIYNMTGFEARNKCFWCGNPIKNTRYCNNSCKNNYRNNFCWHYSSREALRRCKNHCQKCGLDKSLEVHHIIPINGEYRHMSKSNQQDNLIVLCYDCHVNQRKIRNKIPEKQMILL